ncbi:MAG TPA: tRNA (adenosine(37)-N6)-dimethylallyltransferase MiaA [Terriglobales bacterium]|nr:tRNA (adenosine(37)-N6)-dimethylallyltransferase MiaA [Terriglobales bacterium]
MSRPEPLLLVLLGPTASGKTALALSLAEQLQGEIVSCDSVALYRELEIGTAKPSPEERRRVPHHMIDIADPQAQVTAGDYSRLARASLQQIRERGHLPIVVGGTGLYLRALLEGLSPGPPRSEELRSRLRDRGAQRGPEYLHQLLQRLDPEAARSIHPNDVSKVIRALEVCISSRVPMTAGWREGRDPLRGFSTLRIGLNPQREELYRRINARAEEMFRHGLVEETRMLLAKHGNAARALGSLGYKQAGQHIAGEISLPEAISATQQGHRNYAKRQMTWFRREPNVHWLSGFGSDASVVHQARALIAERNFQG